MQRPRVLVAGIGNIFLGDDAFGVEVTRRLLTRPWPDGVRVVDFGIRGLDLTYALLDGADAVVLIDAVRRGGPPGTVPVRSMSSSRTYRLHRQRMRPVYPRRARRRSTPTEWTL